MKKCPYCKTLNNDEQETCVNCLHDITEVSPMAANHVSRWNRCVL